MVFTVLYVIGIAAEAITAALSAGRQKMDLFGVMLLASLTALGGGSVRNMVLGIYPLTWVEHPIYLVIVLAAALLTVGIAFLMHHFRRVFLVLDAVGLAIFSVLGTQIALNHGHGFIIASVASVITGVFGGIMRDLLSDRVPLVMSQELYATISFLATAVYMVLLELGLEKDPAALITVTIAFLLRLWAIRSHKSLPHFEYLGKDQPIDPRLRLSARLVKRGARATKRRATAAARKVSRPLPSKWRRKRNFQEWEVNNTDYPLGGESSGEYGK